MRRLRTPLAVGAALVIALVVVLLVQREASDDGPLAELPPPPPCEQGAADLNPSDRPVAPSRSEPLIERVRNHIPVGFNDSAFLLGQLELDQALRLYDTVGATIWRLPLDWGEVESSPGEIDFSKYDEIYCAAVAAGVHPLWHVTGVPPWAAPLGTCYQPPCVRPPEAEHLPQLRRFAELAAIRFPRSAAFEAWNEPNLTAFWGGVANPSEYLPVLDAIYSGVKDGNPGLPVLGGALANNPTDEPGGNLSLQTYLGAMVEGGALEHMDGLGLHAYPIAPLGSEADRFTPALEIARSTLARGDAGVRIWLTEVGAPTEAGGALPAVTLGQQAGLMADAYTSLDRSDDGDAIIFHTLVDPTPEVPGGPGFGFFTTPAEDGVVPKPVVCEVRRASAANAPCPQGPIGL